MKLMSIKAHRLSVYIIFPQEINTMVNIIVAPCIFVESLQFINQQCTYNFT